MVARTGTGERHDQLMTDLDRPTSDIDGQPPLSWLAATPGHQGHPELFVRSTPGLQPQSHLRWRATCSCGWAGQAEYLGSLEEAGCPPTVNAVTHAEWERHIAPLDALFKLSKFSARRPEHAAELDHAVAQALQLGATWHEVAIATRMTYSDARHRWGS